MLSTSSIYHLCAVSILRFIAIQYPLKSSQTTSTQLTYLILFIIWFISILISSGVIYLGFTDISNVMDEDGKCYLSNHYFMLYGSLISFVIPLLIMILMFSLMARKLRRHIWRNNNHSFRHSFRRSFQRKPKSNLNSSNSSIRRMQESLSNSNMRRFSKKSNKSKNTKKKYSVPLGNEIKNYDCLSTRSKKFYDSMNTGENYCTNKNSNLRPNEEHQMRRHIVKSMANQSSFNTSNSSLCSTSFKNNNNNKPKVKHCQLKTDLGFHLSASSQRLSRAKSVETINLCGTVSHSQIHTEMKALKVLGVVFIAFVIAWLPFSLINIAAAIGFVYEKKIFDLHLYLKYLTYLGYISSTFNPIIYTVFNKKFRTNFLDILRCAKRKKLKNSFQPRHHH